MARWSRAKRSANSAALRSRSLSDVEARHDFQACRNLAGELYRRLRDLLQYAVHAQAHAKHLLVRLEVHIRGAAADRIQQHLVDEAHDRRILDVVARDVVADLVAVAATDFERLEINRIIVAEARHLVVGLLDRLVEFALQLVVFDDNRLDRHAGLELDLVDGVQICRVGDPQEQSLAALEQWQYPVLGEQLVRDGAHGLQVEAEGVEVEQRHAVFGRGGNGNVARLDRATGDQLRDEAGFLLARGLQRSMHAGFVHHPILDQALWQTAQA